MFDKRVYDERLKTLTDRAKKENGYIDDCDIGETAYLETLIIFIKEWKEKRIDKEMLIQKQKELESKLLQHYQHCEIFDNHIVIRTAYSQLLTEAEKGGCSICKKLVKIFDGRKL